MQLKTVLILSLLVTPCYSAQTITPAQMQQLGTAIQDLNQTMRLMSRFYVSAQTAFVKGNIVSVDFSTSTYPLTAQQQQDIIAYYQSLKSQLQTQFSELP